MLSQTGGMFTAMVSRGRERTGNYRVWPEKYPTWRWESSQLVALKLFRSQCLSHWFQDYAEVRQESSVSIEDL